jgi:hypothetical protein
MQDDMMVMSEDGFAYGISVLVCTDNMMAMSESAWIWNLVLHFMKDYIRLAMYCCHIWKSLNK